jgi:hypothetical protein
VRFRGRKYVPGRVAGALADLLQRAQRQGAADKWVQSQVTEDKIYCTYIVPSEDMIRQHTEQGGFPTNRVCEVRSVIDPTTDEA